MHFKSKLICLIVIFHFLFVLSTDNGVCVNQTVLNIQLINNTVFLQDVRGRGLGNLLAVYWSARGLAHLSGYCFSAEWMSTVDSWIFYLPRRTCKSQRNLILLESSCNACNGKDGFDSSGGFSLWEYPQNCIGPWAHMRSAMLVETPHALRQWATHQNISLPIFHPNTHIIYDRCLEKDTLFGHGYYGPVGWSHYNGITCIPGDHCHIIIICIPNSRKGLCELKRAALQVYLIKKFPNAVFQVMSPGASGNSIISRHDRNTFLPFFILSTAPHLYVEVSSFGLWAALSNTVGKVTLTKAMPPQLLSKTPHGFIFNSTVPNSSVLPLVFLDTPVIFGTPDYFMKIYRGGYNFENAANFLLHWLPNN